MSTIVEYVSADLQDLSLVGAQAPAEVTRVGNHVAGQIAAAAVSRGDRADAAQQRFSFAGGEVESGAPWNGPHSSTHHQATRNRHGLSRAGTGASTGTKQVLPVMAVAQLGRDTEGRRYYRRKLAAGKTSMEATRAPEATPVRHRLLTSGGGRQPGRDRPGGHIGATLQSNARRTRNQGRQFGEVTSRTGSPNPSLWPESNAPPLKRGKG